MQHREAGVPAGGDPAAGWGTGGRVAGIGGCRCSGGTRGRADRSFRWRRSAERAQQEGAAPEGGDTDWGRANTLEQARACHGGSSVSRAGQARRVIALADPARDEEGRPRDPEPQREAREDAGPDARRPTNGTAVGPERTAAIRLHRHRRVPGVRAAVKGDRPFAPRATRRAKDAAVPPPVGRGPANPAPGPGEAGRSGDHGRVRRRAPAPSSAWPRRRS